MNDMPFHMSVGSVEVRTTDNRGFTPEEVAERCTDKLLHISEQAPPVIRDQAVAYKQQMTGVIAAYMKQAIRSDRTTVYNAIKDAGH
tara:strand:- start:4254 stop:4514 length:261 start_codon:yes stop_codon:yes gene_type:complete